MPGPQRPGVAGRVASAGQGVPGVLPAGGGGWRRVAAGEAPGYPRFQGRDRYKSFTYPQVGEHGGARLDDGFLVLSKIGRIAVRWSRPLEGTLKTVTVLREADGWYVAFSCAEVPTEPLPRTGRETGIEVGL